MIQKTIDFNAFTVLSMIKLSYIIDRVVDILSAFGRGRRYFTPDPLRCVAAPHGTATQRNGSGVKEPKRCF